MDDAALDQLPLKETVDLASRSFKSMLHKVAEECGRTFDSESVVLNAIEVVLTDQELPLHAVAFALHIASTRASLHVAKGLAGDAGNGR